MTRRKQKKQPNRIPLGQAINQFWETFPREERNHIVGQIRHNLHSAYRGYSNRELTHNMFYGWINKNSFPSEMIPHLASELNNRGMRTPEGGPLPTETELLRTIFPFKNLQLSKSRAPKTPTRLVELLQSIDKKYEVAQTQLKLDSKLGFDVINSMGRRTILIIFTLTVYPLIFRDEQQYEDLYSALANAIAQGARIMVFAPSAKLIAETMEMIGGDGVELIERFEAGIRGCRSQVKIKLRHQHGKDEAVADQLIYTKLDQVHCDRSCVCMSGFVSLLFGEYDDSGELQLWSGIRRVDETFLLTGNSSKFKARFDTRPKHEAAWHLSREKTKLDKSIVELTTKSTAVASQSPEHQLIMANLRQTKWRLEGVIAMLDILMRKGHQ